MASSVASIGQRQWKLLGRLNPGATLDLPDDWEELCISYYGYGSGTVTVGSVIILRAMTQVSGRRTIMAAYSTGQYGTTAGEIDCTTNKISLSSSGNDAQEVYYR